MSFRSLETGLVEEMGSSRDGEACGFGADSPLIAHHGCKPDLLSGSLANLLTLIRNSILDSCHSSLQGWLR